MRKTISVFNVCLFSFLVKNTVRARSQFIPLGIAFGGCRKRVGFIRFEKGEIFWKKTKGTAEGTSKDLDNSVIKLPCANRLVILYPFVYIVLR